MAHHVILLALIFNAPGMDTESATIPLYSWTISVGAEAHPAEQRAADTLAQWWEASTGQRPPVVAGDETGDGPVIRVGASALPDAWREELDLAPLGEDGYVVTTRYPGTVVIAGGAPRGTRYGVLAFIEQALGIRWLALDETHVPEPPEALPELELRFKPVFEYRYSTNYAAETDADTFKDLQRWYSGPSFSCHTFYRYVPPDTFFEDHPEYFSLAEGERRAPIPSNVPHRELMKQTTQLAQLCMMNPEVRALITTQIRKDIQANPDQKYHHVSQMDWDRWCVCPDCQAMDEAEDTHMGSVLDALNEIAETISAESPGHFIETLAYTYTRKPPRTIKPHPAVAIKLCSIECDFSRPLDDPDSPENKVFADDIRDWARISNRLHIWDYTTNFYNFQIPFPNQHVLAANARFFARHNVKGLFEQGSYDRAAEFAPLKAYLLSRLMWDPDTDADAVIAEFLDLYYGPAAPHIRAYIDLVTAKVTGENRFLSFADRGLWYDYDLYEQAEAIFNKAFAASPSEDITRRLETVYATVKLAAMRCPPRITREGDTIVLERPPCMELDDYVAHLESLGMKRIVDFMDTEAFYEQFPGRRLPARRIESELVTLRNDRHEVWIAPGIQGSVLRWRDHGLDAELLRGHESFGVMPGAWQDWNITPGIAEMPVAESYELTEVSETAATLRATLPDGMILDKTISLEPDGQGLLMTMRFTNPTDTPLVAGAKSHPEFYSQGDTPPVIWAEYPDGWRCLTDLPGLDKVKAHGRLIPRNGMTRLFFHAPETGLSLLCAFEGETVGRVLYFYNVGRDARHVNLELIPVETPVPPGGELVLTGRYLPLRGFPEGFEPPADGG